MEKVIQVGRYPSGVCHHGVGANTDHVQHLGL